MKQALLILVALVLLFSGVRGTATVAPIDSRAPAASPRSAADAALPGTESVVGQGSPLGTDGYWFTYKGKPLYLMGSGMESIYTSDSVSTPRESLERWTAYLDLLARYKVNMVRFYAWAFVWEGVDPWEGGSPWHYTSFDPPIYDLDTSSEAYWETVRAVAKEASERDVIFEYVLFEGWLGSETWPKHPWNARTGGPLGNKEDFFDVSNPRNLYFQERYVQKVLDELAGLPNIILEITNELAPNRYSRSWAAYWTAFLKERAPEHLVTISEPSWHFGPELATEAYWEWPGIDVVSAHETRGELALYGGYAQDRFAGYWERGLDKPLMINEWCGVGESLSYADERKFFWTVLTSGGHGVRGCWQPFGETASLPWLRNMADFLDGAVLGRPVDLSRMRPSHNLARLIDVPPGYHVLTLAGVGEEYLMYIRAPQDYRSLVERGQIELDLAPGRYTAFWYDPKSGGVLSVEVMTAGDHPAIMPIIPHQEDIVLFLVSATYLEPATPLVTATLTATPAAAPLPTATPTPAPGTATPTPSASPSPTPAPGIIGAQVVVGPDDTGVSYGVNRNDDYPLITQTGRNAGGRFQNINIPQGSIITSAYVELYLHSGSFGNIDANIYGDASDNSVNFATTNPLVDNRVKTFALGTWSTLGLGRGYQRSPDISSIVQEIIGRPGWTGGNSLSILMFGRSAYKMEACSYDNTFSGSPWAYACLNHPPRLHVEYIAGGQPATLLVTATATPTALRTATPTTVLPPTATPTTVLLPTVTPTTVLLPTVTPTPTQLPTASPTPTPTPTSSPSASPTVTPTPTV